MLRRREVRLARSRVDHVDSLLAQLIRLSHGGERSRGLNAIDSFRQADRMGDWGHYGAHVYSTFFFLGLLLLSEGALPAGWRPFSNL